MTLTLLRAQNVHAYAFTFEMNRKRPECGVSLRVRRGRVWRHFHVALYTVGTQYRIGRGVLGIEAKTWRTLDGTDGRRRRGMKAFVRLKVGLGGNPA